MSTFAVCKPGRTRGTFPWCAAALLLTAACHHSAPVAAPLPLPPEIAPGQLASLPGTRIWYLDTGGEGTAVVFLHAGTGSSRMWEFQVPAVTQAGYRFIAYDRRGYGRTTVDSPTDRKGSEATDLLALLDQLHLGRVFLVGTGAGGGVALDFVLSHPERVRGLVLANTLGNITDSSYRAMGRFLRPPAFDALPAALRELSPSYRAADPEGTKRWTTLIGLSRAPGPPVRSRASLHRATFAMLEKLSVPTLLMTGDADLYTPPSVLRMFKAHMQDAAMVIAPETGHSAFWEQPELFNRSIISFMRSHPR